MATGTWLVGTLTLVSGIAGLAATVRTWYWNRGHGNGLTHEGDSVRSRHRHLVRGNSDHVPTAAGKLAGVDTGTRSASRCGSAAWRTPR